MDPSVRENQLPCSSCVEDLESHESTLDWVIRTFYMEGLPKDNGSRSHAIEDSGTRERDYIIILSSRKKQSNFRKNEGMGGRGHCRGNHPKMKRARMWSDSGN